MLGSVIVAPMSPHGTCVGQGGHPVIEYFVISHGIAASVVSVGVDGQSHANPHMPVHLAVRRSLPHLKNGDSRPSGCFPPGGSFGPSPKPPSAAIAPVATRAALDIIACNGRWASAAAALTAAYRHVAILTALEVAGQVDVALSTAEVEAYGGTAALVWSTPCWLT